MRRKRALTLSIFSASTISVLLLVVSILSGCSPRLRARPSEAPRPFAIAVIPDTQNYVDYRHQPSQGFAVDGSALFIAQMRDVAARSVADGGDVVFVASVGDVWQHQTQRIDPDHQRRGFAVIDNPILALEMEVTEETTTYEIPKSVEGYEILADAGLPFGVAPGNHDYDAMWSAEGFPPDLSKSLRELTMTPEDLGMLHVGGLDNFRSAFGADSAFFSNKPWYVGSVNGGASSAQTFVGGGYTFLHIALEMQASDAVLEWASALISAYPGVPTIVTTHDYLAADGERRPNPIVDLDRIDPDHHNGADELWDKLLSRHDQIFLVLCGHHHGQSMRVDDNRSGNPVYQILADYQDRGQVGLDAGVPRNRYTGRPIGLGDGWYRLMSFDLAAEPPRLRVRTYSSHYEKHSRELETYAAWYKSREKAGLSDADFHATDDFEIVLDGFAERFENGRALRE